MSGYLNAGGADDSYASSKHDANRDMYTGRQRQDLKAVSQSITLSKRKEITIFS